MSAKMTLRLPYLCFLMTVCSIEGVLINQFIQHHGFERSFGPNWFYVISMITFCCLGDPFKRLIESLFKDILWSRSILILEAPTSRGAGLVRCGGEPFHLRTNNRNCARGIFFWSLTLIGLVVSVGFLVSAHGGGEWGRRFGFFLLASLLTAGFAVGFWFSGETREEIVNSDGIRGIPWSYFKICEIVTFRTRSGKPMLIQPIFKDSSGNVLLSLDLLDARIAEQERLVEYLEMRLPKSPIETLVG